MRRMKPENEQIINLKTKLIFNNNAEKQQVIELLEQERECFNYCSKAQFKLKKRSIVELHAKCYKKLRKKYPQYKSMIIIIAENNCLSAYKSIKSNKHKITEPAIKHKLSTCLNKQSCIYKNNEFYILSSKKRIAAKPILYDTLSEYFNKYSFGDVNISSDGIDVFISIPFRIIVKSLKSTYALGIDVGIRRLVATSEGNIYIDKKFNKEKRRLRYLKRCLYSKIDKGSKTAKRHLRKLKLKERNKNKNQLHHLANKVINDTKCNTFVVEKLNTKNIKIKRSRYQNKNRVSQVSFSEFIRILAYKAALAGKQVVSVSPYYTSQIDHVTGRKEGIRKGCRFYAVSGCIYDSDLNAAINIAKRYKLPVSCGNVLDGQAVVNQPIETKIN